VIRAALGFMWSVVQVAAAMLVLTAVVVAAFLFIEFAVSLLGAVRVVA